MTVPETTVGRFDFRDRESPDDHDPSMNAHDERPEDSGPQFGDQDLAPDDHESTADDARTAADAARGADTATDEDRRSEAMPQRTPGADTGDRPDTSLELNPDEAIIRALDELNEGLLVFQRQRVLSANDAFTRMVGRSRAELAALDSVLDLLAEDQRALLGERVTRYILGEDVPDHMEATVLVAGGRRIHVELAVKAVVRSGPDTVFVALVRDVTGARRESRIARLLSDTSEIVAGARDEVAAIRAISRLLVPAVADWCAFDVQDLDGSLTRIAASHVTPQGEALLWELDRRFPVRQFEGNLRARVLRSGTPLVMNTITDSVIRATARNHEHAEMLRDLGMGAAMWVPATSLGRTFGVMSLGRIAADRPFDDADLDVAAKLGHRAAQAIERSSADRTIRARERQQAAVAELGRMALAGMSLEELQQHAVRLLAETLDVELSSALEMQPDGESLRLVSGIGWSAADLGGLAIPIDASTQAGYTVTSGGPVLVEDLRTETRFRPTDIALGFGVVSGLSVVIASRGDRPYGVLMAHTTARRRFGGDDVNFVRAIANVVATAIERREAEAALRESDERLHLALAASRTGTWEWNLRTGALTWSDEILRLHGLPPGHEVPTFDEYLEMIHPEDRPVFQAALAEALEGSSYDLDYRLILPDGTIRWTNGTGRIFRDSSGAAVRMVGTGRDTTERKETEQERDRLLEHERTARELRDAFIGVLSHELRTPITTILGGSRLVADRLGTMPAETAAELLNDIGQEADRLARLIEDLLVLTRAERGTLEAPDDPVLPTMVLDNILASSSSITQRVSLNIDVPRNLPIVLGDETYLEQILRNLIGNAAKFSPPGSTVTVAAHVTPAEVVIRVLDEGPGIEPDEAERLFDVFYRSPNTKSKVAGSGIGLFVARQLTLAMGGRIWATRRPEGGAEFGIALQRHELPPDELAEDELDDAR